MMSLAFLLVFFSNDQLRSILFKLLSGLKDRFAIFMLLLLFTAGLVLSLYHVFTQRERTIIEKHIMLFFAVLTNAVSGIYASVHILSKSTDAHCIFILLPIWNIINCLILLVSYRVGIISADNISDENIRGFEAFLGFIITVAIFAACQFVFHLHWAITFSICVIYATSFGEALHSMFHPQRQPTIAKNFATGIKVEGTSQEEDLEKCGFCSRLITKAETPWVIGKKTIVCKQCYDKIKEAKEEIGS